MEPLQTWTKNAKHRVCWLSEERAHTAVRYDQSQSSNQIMKKSIYEIIMTYGDTQLLPAGTQHPFGGLESRHLIYMLEYQWLLPGVWVHAENVKTVCKAKL